MIVVFPLFYTDNARIIHPVLNKIFEEIMTTEWLKWLDKIHNLHITDMDLSLERVYQVADSLCLLKKKCPVITVAGTNGKGSCVAGLAAIYLAAGYRVGTFTSPVLFRHNEYVRINGQEATDQAFCDAYARIEAVRDEITLTAFEFTALAALLIFQETDLDVWILEVGLGGRYDAVNVIDADVAIIASIGIDHVDWLGDTREKIAYEKAGIFRANQFVVCGDLDPPQTLMDCAQEIGAVFYQQNKDFSFTATDVNWHWQSQTQKIDHLPLPKLALQNMATVLMVIELLQPHLPVTTPQMKTGLKQLTLPGRIEVIPGDITHIFDVSHNPAAAEFLADYLRQYYSQKKIRAVFSMLADKDILSTILMMQPYIDTWYIASLPVKRAASLEKLCANFQQANITSVKQHDSIEQAYQTAFAESELNDCIVVFGSFHTVASIIPVASLPL